MSRECRAEHIAVGSEILLGQIANTHAKTVSVLMAEHGFYLYHHSSVGDNLDRICQLFALASKRSNVVIVTGGLGPTVDDLTKEALAQHLGRSLYMSEAALQDLTAYFARSGRKMPEENKKQAMCIDSGELLENPNGTAPGQYICDADVHYFLLPGPPLEMKPMLVNQVLPRLMRIFSDRQALVSRVLHFCGIGESTVDEQITDLTNGNNPTVAPLAGEGEMLLRITASDATAALAEARIAPVEQELRNRFAPFIYGVDADSLPKVVGDVLLETGSTIAFAESCTGGLISEMMTDIAGASRYLLGSVIAYQNDVKAQLLGVKPVTLEQTGAVSKACAKEMAEGVRDLCGSTYGVSVTGIAGPEGGTPEKPVGLVFAAIAGPNGTEAYQMKFRGSRQQVRIRAAKQVLWRTWQMAVRDRQI